MDYNCPKCKSENIQKLEITYKTGKSGLSGSSSSVGVAASSSGVGVGITGGTFSGTQQTDLSQMVAPPKLKKKRPGCILTFSLLSGFAYILIGSTALLIGLVIIAIGIYYYIYGTRYNNNEYAEYADKLRVWERSYICLRCGQIFQKSYSDNENIE